MPEQQGSESRVHIDPEQRYGASGGSPLTPAEDQAGATALKTYIDGVLEANGLAWEEAFIPDTAFVQGATDVIEAADAADDQSPAGRQAAGATALRAALEAVGQSDKVSDTNLNEGVSAVLTAVAKVRAQENPPQKPSAEASVEAQPVEADDGWTDTSDDDPATAPQTQTGVAGAGVGVTRPSEDAEV